MFSSLLVFKIRTWPLFRRLSVSNSSVKFGSHFWRDAEARFLSGTRPTCTRNSQRHFFLSSTGVPHFYFHGLQDSGRTRKREITKISLAATDVIREISFSSFLKKKFRKNGKKQEHEGLLAESYTRHYFFFYSEPHWNSILCDNVYGFGGIMRDSLWSHWRPPPRVAFGCAIVRATARVFHYAKWPFGGFGICPQKEKTKTR